VRVTLTQSEGIEVHKLSDLFDVHDIYDWTFMYTYLSLNQRYDKNHNIV